MTSEQLGLIGLAKNSPLSHLTCAIHQQDLHTEVVNFQHMISIVQKPSYQRDFRTELLEGAR
jgi:hypothetical protein